MISKEELIRIANLPDDQQLAEIHNYLAVEFHNMNSTVMQERDQYQHDLSVVIRIIIDLGKAFGIVNEDDSLKQLEEGGYGAAIFEKVGSMMDDYLRSKIPGIGKKYIEKARAEFEFMKAIKPMVTKYKPCSKEELTKVVNQVTL